MPGAPVPSSSRVGAHTAAKPAASKHRKHKTKAKAKIRPNTSDPRPPAPPPPPPPPIPLTPPSPTDPASFTLAGHRTTHLARATLADLTPYLGRALVLHAHAPTARDPRRIVTRTVRRATRADLAEYLHAETWVFTPATGCRPRGGGGAAVAVPMAGEAKAKGAGGEDRGGAGRCRSPHVHFAQEGRLGATKREKENLRGKKKHREPLARQAESTNAQSAAGQHPERQAKHQPGQRARPAPAAVPAPVTAPAPQPRVGTTAKPAAAATSTQWWSPNPAFCCAPSKWPAPHDQVPKPRTADASPPGSSPYGRRSAQAAASPYAYRLPHTPYTPYTPQMPRTPCAQAAYTYGSPGSYAPAPAHIHSPFPFRPAPVATALEAPWVGYYGTPAWGGGGAAGLAY